MCNKGWYLSMRALLQMCQHLEQLTRTIEMTVAPMLQTATASKVGCSRCD